jgi:DNA-binding transcriptional LysR family regulator
VFSVAFVPGVAPGRWERAWRDRMPREPFELRQTPQDEALAALLSGSIRMAFLRDVDRGEHEGVPLHVIPLYRETPVVVAPKDHPVAAFDELDLADLAGEPILEGSDAAVVEVVATGAGLALMPGPVARDASRRDVVARPVRDAPDTGIGLVWREDDRHPLIPVFIGIVRGRTANSSR